MLMFDRLTFWMYDHPEGVIAFAALGVASVLAFAFFLARSIDDP